MEARPDLGPVGRLDDTPALPFIVFWLTTV
jgi:hypothetical protein